VPSGAAPATTVAPDAKPRRYRLSLTASAAQAFAAFEALTKLADVANRMQITI
jgi:hypothetical protein